MISNSCLPQSTITVGSIIESKTSHQVAGHKWLINRQRDRWWCFQPWSSWETQSPRGYQHWLQVSWWGFLPEQPEGNRAQGSSCSLHCGKHTCAHSACPGSPGMLSARLLLQTIAPLCAGCLRRWWGTGDPGTQGAWCRAQGVCGTLGGFLEGTRTMHPWTLAFRVGFSLPCVATLLGDCSNIVHAALRSCCTLV